MLEWIKSKTNVVTIKGKKNYNTEKHKSYYTHTVKYNDALNLVREIEPYLVINSKKLRAKLILSDYKNVTPRNERYSSEMIELKQKFHESFIKIK